MKKALIWIALVVGVLVLLSLIAWPVLKQQTKKASPEETVELKSGDLELSVYYNRPSKKGRVIFGELVPYNEVWRTGANEATTFTTNKDLLIDGQTLAAGKYTLWTIPDEDNWTVIFNDKMYGWGISFSGGASRNPEHDVLKTMAPIINQKDVTEMFTIALEEDPLAMTLAWDQVKIRVPMQMQ